MTQKTRKIFLDTSVVFAVVLSPTGGARKLFQLGEAGFLKLFIGHHVLWECDQVIRRKAPGSLPVLARLLDAGQVETSPVPTMDQIEAAQCLVEYRPDAYVLAEAMASEPDWLVTHDKEHFLKEHQSLALGFRIGTPGDLLQSMIDDLMV
jgi:predicted nucleic acid-binding protein